MSCFKTLASLAIFVCTACMVRADIRRWDTGEVIPGTEGVVVANGVQLNGLDLSFADLSLAMLGGASFQGSTLESALFDDSSLAGANFSNAVIVGASFSRTTEHGFAKEQLYSTASYGSMNVAGVFLNENDLTAWDFSGQNLTAADLSQATLTSAKFTGADLSQASLFGSTLGGAEFTGAVITGADLGGTAFNAQQLASTVNYQQKNLQNIVFAANNLSGADLTGQNLTSADLSLANLSTAKFDSAIIAQASLRETVANGFTKEQLYATQDYQERNLQSIGFEDNNLAGWDFSNQNLGGARLNRSNLDGANFAGANIGGASFGSATFFSKEQLYATASYQAKDLRNVRLDNLPLVGWDFKGQDLRGVRFASSDLASADFSLADLRGATGFQPAPSTMGRSTIDQDSIVVQLDLKDGETLVAHAGPFLGLPIGIFGLFSIASTAKLDLNDNAAIAYNASPEEVRLQLIAGRNHVGLGGLWNGTGIASSVVAAENAASAESRSIGYARNGSLPLGAYEEFHGFPVDENAVLFAYTRTGDANLDGVVNDEDVTVVSATYAPGVDQPEWFKGDFDYNGFVDDDDITLLGAFYDPSATPLGGSPAFVASTTAAVPEPGAMALVVVGGMVAVALLVRCDGRRRI